MRSPGDSTGTPGGYGQIISAQTRPTAECAATTSCCEKKASLGLTTTSGTIENAAATDTGRGSPRWALTDAMMRSIKSSMRSGVSAKVIIGIIRSRFAISTSMLAANKSASTLLPSDPQLGIKITSLSGSIYSPSITSMPAARKLARPFSVASITGSINS